MVDRSLHLCIECEMLFSLISDWFGTNTQTDKSCKKLEFFRFAYFSFEGILRTEEY